MKAIVKIFLLFLVLVMVLVVFAFIIPREINVERTIVINAVPEVVFSQVNTLRNWEKWSPWHQIDPDMEISYVGPESGAGASCFWKSEHNQVGNGSITITTSKPFERIEIDMNFMEQRSATGYYTFSKEGDGTKMTWGLYSDLGNNPLMRYLGLVMEKFIGEDFDEGLVNLKAHIESMSEEKLNALIHADIELLDHEFNF